MGAASYNRGSDSIGRGLYREQKAAADLAELSSMLTRAEECETFAREAWAYVLEPIGLRSLTVESRKKRRKYTVLLAALGEAHNVWVDNQNRNTKARCCAAVRKAQAAYALLTYCLGPWTVPDKIKVPRCAVGRQ
jgi:hypothetical protein